jgi:hypothetical protein
MHPKAIAWTTDIAYMSSEERKMVFDAYEFNQHKQLYELKKPELLNDSLIEKLRRMD